MYRAGSHAKFSQLSELFHRLWLPDDDLVVLPSRLNIGEGWAHHGPGQKKKKCNGSGESHTCELP
jgi:hypothetical protein